MPGSKFPPRLSFLLLAAALALAFLMVVVAASTEAKTITVDDDGGEDFTSIQEAIEAAGINDTIRVYTGNYQERLNITKQLRLEGNGSSYTFIDGGGGGDVVNISADHVSFTGFGVTGGGKEYWDAGLVLDGNYCELRENEFYDNSNGLFLHWYASNNDIRNNSIRDNVRDGVYGSLDGLWNSFFGNTVTGNGGRGIDLYSPQHNYLENNIFSKNGATGIRLDWGYHNLIANNTCSDNVLDGIGLFHCSDTLIYANTLRNNRYGVYLFYEDDAERYGNNNTLIDNIFEGNEEDVHEEIEDFFEGCLTMLGACCVTVALVIGVIMLIFRKKKAKELLVDPSGSAPYPYGQSPWPPSPPHPPTPPEGGPPEQGP